MFIYNIKVQYYNYQSTQNLRASGNKVQDRSINESAAAIFPVLQENTSMHYCVASASGFPLTPEVTTQHRHKTQYGWITYITTLKAEKKH